MSAVIDGEDEGNNMPPAKDDGKKDKDWEGKYWQTLTKIINGDGKLFRHMLDEQAAYPKRRPEDDQPMFVLKDEKEAAAFPLESVMEWAQGQFPDKEEDGA